MFKMYRGVLLFLASSSSAWCPLGKTEQALFDAIEARKTEEAKRFLTQAINQEINLNVCNSEGITLLNHAVSCGELGITYALLEDGADIDASDSATEYRWTPLHYAAANGQEEIIELLLQREVKVDSIDERGATPLHYAAAYANPFVIRKLLEGGANIEAVDKYRQTPLFYAIYKGTLAEVRFLLQKNANVNACDNDRLTPLHSAAKAEYPQAATLLLQENADVNAVDKDGKTPLHHAAEDGCQRTAAVLLQGGANINAVDNDGKTPYDLTKDPDIIRLLENAKAEKAGTELCVTSPRDAACKTLQELHKNKARKNRKRGREET
jgi:ankyrin repeat protein